MSSNCLDINQQGISLKKYKVELSPYLQEKTGLDPVIFTNNIDELYASLESVHGSHILKDISHKDFHLTSEMDERYRRITSMCLEYSELINHIEDYSLFVYYGYIRSNTTSDGLKTIQVHYEEKSKEYLIDILKTILKIIRKDLLQAPITYKGNPYLFDKESMMNLAYLEKVAEYDPTRPIMYRLENAEFISLTLEDIREILRFGNGFLQSVMEVEKELLDHYRKLDITQLENYLLTRKQLEIKVHFDTKIKEKKW